MTERARELERIAQQYHLSADVPDKFIEDICQEYCCDWLASLIQADDDVIEMGYGEGITTARLSGLARRYTVVEGADSLAKVIRQKHSEVKVVHRLFEDHQPEEPCDRLLALHVMEHVDDPVALGRHLYGWVKPGGELLVIVPNRDSLHRRLAVSMGLQAALDTLSSRDHLVGHQRVYDLPSLESDLRASGFEPFERRGFFLKTLPNGMMLDYSPALIQALNMLGSELPVTMTANLAVRARRV